MAGAGFVGKQAEVIQGQHMMQQSQHLMQSPVFSTDNRAASATLPCINIKPDPYHNLLGGITHGPRPLQQHTIRNPVDILQMRMVGRPQDVIPMEVPQVDLLRQQSTLSRGNYVDQEYPGGNMDYMAREYDYGGDDSDGGGTKRRRTSDLPLDERARQNRNRNREHARNTRLRKKAYVEDLKRTVQRLTERQALDEKERSVQAQRKAELENFRLHIIERYMALRGDCNRSPHSWQGLVDEEFVVLQAGMLMGGDGQPPLRGVQSALADVAELQKQLDVIGKGSVAHSWIQNLVDEAERERQRVKLSYVLDRNDLCSSNFSIMVPWRATTVNAVLNGASKECTMKGGMLRASFNHQNKMHLLDLSFNTSNFDAEVIEANTHVATSPPMTTLQQQHPRHVLDEVMEAVRKRQATSAFFGGSIDDASGAAMRSYLRIFPLSSEGPHATHFIGVLQEIEASSIKSVSADDTSTLNGAFSSEESSSGGGGFLTSLQGHQNGSNNSDDAQEDTSSQNDEQDQCSGSGSQNGDSGGSGSQSGESQSGADGGDDFGNFIRSNHQITASEDDSTLWAGSTTTSKETCGSSGNDSSSGNESRKRTRSSTS